MYDKTLDFPFLILLASGGMFLGNLSHRTWWHHHVCHTPGEWIVTGGFLTGNCQLVLAEAMGKFRRLGTTLDDAPGEAYDKVSVISCACGRRGTDKAVMFCSRSHMHRLKPRTRLFRMKVARYLGLSCAGMSGGAAVEAAARNATKPIRLAVPMTARRDCNFSFSGLKTQVRCVPYAVCAYTGSRAVATPLLLIPGHAAEGCAKA